MTPRPLSSTVWAAPQVSPADLPALAEAGIRRLICNRPDHEDADQPSAAEMEVAAQGAGMTFAWIPVQGLPDGTQVAAAADLLADGVPTLMFCRSGTRSAALWAMAERLRGADAAELRAATAAAGYDLSRLPL